jgi:hypothetical protein
MKRTEIASFLFKPDFSGNFHFLAVFNGFLFEFVNNSFKFKPLKAAKMLKFEKNLV